ncbi:MAG: hypothetical protein AB1758_38035, partial [Candidatus Eremiobacterota bacterium]
WRDFLRDHGRDVLTEWRRLESVQGEPGCADLLASLQELRSAVDPGQAWGELRVDLLEWEEAYRQRYTRAHDEHYASEVFQLRQRVTRLPEWKAVESMAGILGLKVQPGPAQLKHRLSDLPQRCNRSQDDQLVLGMRCACGFSPGQPLPECPDLVEEVRRGLVSACRDLSAAERQDSLDAFLRGLRQVGQDERARRLEEVLSAAAELSAPEPLPGLWTRVPQKLVHLLDGPCVEALSRALTGQTLVAVRRLEDLVSRLEGQRLPVVQLRRIVEEWLAGPDLRPDGWVHVESGGDADRECAAWLRRWLQQHGLAPSQAMRRRFPVNGSDEPSGDPSEVEPRLSELLEESARALDPVAGALSERIFPGVSRVLCRRALALAVEDEATASRLADLPEEPWEHLSVARLTASALHRRTQEGYPAVGRALADWARARHEDLSAGLLEGLEASVQTVLQRSLESCPLPTLPLSEVPRMLADFEGPWVAFVVDGLRWDLWDLLRPVLEAELGPPQQENLALSPLPS